MKRIPITIDSSNSDAEKIKRFLSGYDRAIRIYDGDYTAPWLLSDIHDVVWYIKTSKTIKQADGTYKYTRTINWNRLLEDGSWLSDEENTEIREFLQQAIFVIFESPVFNRQPSDGTTASTIFFVFVSWLFNNELALEPKTNGLARITQARLIEFITSYAIGGPFEVLKTGERIIERYEELSGNRVYSKDLYSLSEEEVSQFCEFLRSNKCYKTSNYNCEVVDRVRFSKLFEVSKHEKHSHRFTLFLRQFEPEVLEYNDQVLMPVSLENEHPGHTTPLIDDVRDSACSSRYVKTIINTLEMLLKLKSLFPDFLPKAETLRLGELRRLIDRLSKAEGHTPWIPLPVSLELLNRSIETVLLHGDCIIRCLDEIYFELIEHNMIGNHASQCRSKSKLEKRRKIIFNVCKDLEFPTTSFSSREKSFAADGFPDGRMAAKAEALRMNPSLLDLVTVLYGACFIVIAGLKPMRVQELSSLKYGCLFYKSNDGFWLEHELQKSGIKGILPETAKPIPKIAAKAIAQLMKLNGLAEKYSHRSSKKESSYLLYSLTLPEYRSASVMDVGGIRDAMATFCDFINLPTDTYGRRWYVNTHELRKSFVLTFFWVFKYSSLDACRWIAGHKDPDHVLSYIEANLPGEEMVEIEAEYAQQQLRLFNSNYSLAEMENVELLNQSVCEHFNVKSVSEVKEDELNDWLRYAIETGEYHIHAYGLEADSHEFSANVAFSIREV